MYLCLQSPLSKCAFPELCLILAGCVPEIQKKICNLICFLAFNCEIAAKFLFYIDIFCLNT
jgi:hypothetical protein